MPTVDEIKNKALKDIDDLGGHLRRAGAMGPLAVPGHNTQDELVRRAQLVRTHREATRQLQEIGGADAEAAIEEVNAAARELVEKLPKHRSEPLPHPNPTDKAE